MGVTRPGGTSSGPSQTNCSVDQIPGLPLELAPHHKATILQPIAKSSRYPDHRTAAAINNHNPAAAWGRALLRKPNCCGCALRDGVPINKPQHHPRITLIHAN
jgi:hypothetical protein